MSGRRKNPTDLEKDVKLVVSVAGAGYTWTLLLAVLEENDFLPVLLYCPDISYFLNMHNPSNLWISYS